MSLENMEFSSRGYLHVPCTPLLIYKESYPGLYAALDAIGFESLVWLLIATVIQMIAHNPLLWCEYADEFDKIKDETYSIEDLDPRIAAMKDDLPTISEEDEEAHKNRDLIAVNGYWYDVTKFIKTHPGGDIIKTYLRCDCTSTFYGVHPHPQKIIGMRRPVARHTTSKDYLQKNKRANELYWRLHNRYTEMGLFVRSQPWLHAVQAINVVLAGIMIWACWHYPQNAIINGLLTGNFLLGGAFLLHDSAHCYVSEDKRVNSANAWLWGDVVFGVSSRWWKDEHDEHHSITNTFDPESGIITDRQASEDFWCQNEKVVGFFRAFYHPVVIRIQHWLAMPLALLGGRTGITVDCWIHEIVKGHWKNVLGFVIHWCWLLELCRWHNNPWLFYFIFQTYQGTLAIQLISNHLWKPFIELEDAKYVNFGQRMTEVNCNFKTSPWFDYWFGGLHFHIEHHMFPKLPRYNLRRISKDMKKMMKEIGVDYHYDYLWNIAIDLHRHLKKVGGVWQEDYKIYSQRDIQNTQKEKVE